MSGENDGTQVVEADNAETLAKAEAAAKEADARFKGQQRWETDLLKRAGAKNRDDFEAKLRDLLARPAKDPDTAAKPDPTSRPQRPRRADFIDRDLGVVDEDKFDTAMDQYETEVESYRVQASRRAASEESVASALAQAVGEIPTDLLGEGEESDADIAEAAIADRAAVLAGDGEVTVEHIKQASADVTKRLNRIAARQLAAADKAAAAERARDPARSAKGAAAKDNPAQEPVAKDDLETLATKAQKELEADRRR